MKLPVAICMVLFSGCKSNSSAIPSIIAAPSPVTILIQPFENIDTPICGFLKKGIARWYRADVLILNRASIPTNAYYPPRDRFIADSLLVFLANKSEMGQTFVLGVTGRDISTSKGNHSNWGIMGLGYQPGNACIISGFRIKKGKPGVNEFQQNLLKVALHELGHNFGLPHCNNQTCFMVDAEGKDKLNGEKEFCKKCGFYLDKNGFL